MESKNPKLYLVRFIFDIEIDAFNSDEAYEFAKEHLSQKSIEDWDDCHVMEIGDLED